MNNLQNYDINLLSSQELSNISGIRLSSSVIRYSMTLGAVNLKRFVDSVSQTVYWSINNTPLSAKKQEHKEYLEMLTRKWNAQTASLTINIQ